VSNDIVFEPVHRQLNALTRGDYSARELTAAYLDRIDRFDPQLNAFVTVFRDEALQAAESADQQRMAGNVLGTLHGIPFGLKDIIEVEGQPAGWGCHALVERVSPLSATVAERLTASGAILLGKTQSVEFALGGWGTNQHCGTPWNPWDLKTHRVPGGSSSGSGVAVAAGLASAALGTDTGGSVRLPSAFCGLTGLKPTFGRVSNHGVMPLSHSLDTVGPMARCVEDVALIYEVLQGPDAQDQATQYLPAHESTAGIRDGIQSMRLAVLPDSQRKQSSESVNLAYEKTLECAGKLGAEIVIRGLPHPFETYRNLSSVIASAEGYAHCHELIDRQDLPIGDGTRARMLPGKTCSAKEYLEAMNQMELWRREYEKHMRGIDALLTPTATAPAIAVEDVDENILPAFYTRATNVLGLCALALPNGQSDDGLPLSLCLHGHAFAEATVLRIGWALEQALGENSRIPPGLT